MTSKVLGDVAPPLSERPKGVGGMVAFPVELRRDVVDSSLLEPRQRVAEERRVLPVAACGARIHAMLRGTCGGSSGHTCRPYREAHLRLGGLHHVIHIGHHLVNLSASPVGETQRCAAVAPQVVVGCAAVGGNAAGIEVIVEDEPVDVVVLNHLPAHVHDALARSRQARVEHGGCRARAVSVAQQDARVDKSLILSCVPC